jgi:hypothetical protein
MMMLAATVLCAALLGLGAFQKPLAAGAPIGHVAWGVQYRVLPMRLQIGSIVSTVLYAVFAVVILGRDGILSVLPEPASLTLTWVIEGLLLWARSPT